MILITIYLQVAAVADSTKSKPAEPPVEEVKEPAAMEAKSQVDR
jgi:hypothetical protein